MPVRFCARRNARKVLEEDKSLGSGLSCDVVVGESTEWKESCKFWKEREVTFREVVLFEGSVSFALFSSALLFASCLALCVSPSQSLSLCCFT